MRRNICVLDIFLSDLWAPIQPHHHHTVHGHEEHKTKIRWQIIPHHDYYSNKKKKSQQRVHVPMTATTLVEWKRKHPWAIISYEWVNFISKNDQIIIPTDILTCPVSTNENARVSRTLEKQKALAKVDAWKLYQRWWYVINVEVSARAKRVGWRDGFIFYGKSQCSRII